MKSKYNKESIYKLVILVLAITSILFISLYIHQRNEYKKLNEEITSGYYNDPQKLIELQKQIYEQKEDEIRKNEALNNQ